MGRINNSVEIIPIDGPSGLNSRQILNRDEQVKMNTYISDPYIVQRVRQYLESNVDKTYIDIAEMADYLQNKFKEYSRRKKTAFRGLVKRAYSAIVKTYGSELHGTSTDSDAEDAEDNQSNDFLNDQIGDMYSRSAQSASLTKNEENELIDISSDDSEVPAKQKEACSNGPPISTSSSVPDSASTQARICTYSTNSVERTKKRKYEVTTTSLSKRKKEIPVYIPSVTFKDLGGIENILSTVSKLLLHIRHPEVYRKIGITPPRGFLLYGPPGCGKTLLANAIAGELYIPLLKVAAPELVAGISGESEERIRELFNRAVETAPCILLIDEIDAITPNRQQTQKEMERRIVAQLLACLDELGHNECADRILVIGATNRPDALDPALRRAGRFDREVCLGIPDLQSRVNIIKILTAKLKLQSEFNYLYIAKHTPGFVGADLMALVREAAMAAINRVFIDIQKGELSKQKGNCQEINNETDGKESQIKQKNSVCEKNSQNETHDCISIDKNTSLLELKTWLHGDAPLNDEQLSNLCIEIEDFKNALKCVQPSAKREGFATVPDVTWDDIGSLQDIRQELQMSILGPVHYAEQFKLLGLSTKTGVLLCGPPGCGKTLLAKAVANEAGINFISVKGPELLNMYVGESERAVRQCFQRARTSIPCVIFFDELDALCPKRSDVGEGGASMRVVNQMLTEMDGIEDREGVFLMAASNRPDVIDPAVLRPGRLDKILYVGLPSPEDRVDILNAITKGGTKPTLALDVNLTEIGKSEQCEGFTGADLAALVKEAGIEAMKEYMKSGTVKQVLVTNEHFKKAIGRIRPSITEKDQKHYDKLRKLYSFCKELRHTNEEEVMECS